MQTTGMSDDEIMEILQEAREPREPRATAAYFIPQATRFSDDKLMKDKVHLVKQLMGSGELWDTLREMTTDPDQLEREKKGRASRVGAPRIKGDIAPIMLAYVVSRTPEMMHFHSGDNSSPVWALSGWGEEAPCYGTFYNRVVEAEQCHLAAWEWASRYCWQIVRKHVPEAARFWWIDGTPYECHVKAKHRCLDPVACAAHGGKQMPKWIERAGLEEINEERQERQALPPEDEPEEDEPEMTAESLLADLAERVKNWDADFEEVALDQAFPEAKMPKYRRKRKSGVPLENLQTEIFIRWEKDTDYKHRYVVRDPDCGFRIYQREGRKFRQWLGGIAMTISDDATEAMIGQFHLRADLPESWAYLDTLALGLRTTGRLPQCVIIDRASNTRAVRKINALLGIGQVTAFRRPHQSITKRSQMRRDTHDEYGFPTCHYCGGPGIDVGLNLGFELRNGVPVRKFRCAAGVELACRTSLQRIPCSTEYLLVGAISRDDPLYYELRGQGKPKERAQALSRTRGGGAGKDLTSRPKRIGIPFMALRSGVAAFLDVFRLCLRHGWLGTHPKTRPAVLVQRTGGKEAVAAMRRFRQRVGLLLPRGKKAEKLGLVFDGVIPDGYKTIKQRKRARADAAKKKAAEKSGKNKGSPVPT